MTVETGKEQKGDEKREVMSTTRDNDTIVNKTSWSKRDRMEIKS